MSKAVGAVLIMAGSVYLIANQVRKKRLELDVLQSLIGALRAMEAAIRWKRQAVPECLKELEQRKYCGEYFRKIRTLMESGNTLHDAWQKTFQTFPQDIKAILLAMEWEGDELHLLGTLQYTAQGLSELYHQRQVQRRNENKLLTAAIGSAAGLLILILL